MKRVFRHDFYIDCKDDTLMVVNENNQKVFFPINQAHAIYLSLFDGLREDNEIAQIVYELFGVNCDKFESMNRFLMPIDQAYTIFGQYVPQYMPEYFLDRKYKSETNSSNEWYIPRYMTLCLTNYCYRSCIYCYANAEKSDSVEVSALGMYEYNNILAEIFEMAVEGVLLTGGEPLMHPCAYEIIKYLCSHGIKTQVLTKYPLDEKKLKEIDIRFLDICLSIDSYKPDIANYLTSSLGFFDDMIQNIRILNKLNIPFNATVVITKLNINHIIETVEFLLKLGAKHIFTNYYSNNNGKMNVLEVSSIEKENFDKKIKEFINKLSFSNRVIHNEHGSNKDDIHNMKCGGLFKKVTIDYNGKYLLCDHARNIETEFQSVQNQTILEHFNSERMNLFRYPPKVLYKGTACEKCKRFEECVVKNSCYANSYAQYSNLFKPLKEIEDVCNKK